MKEKKSKSLTRLILSVIIGIFVYCALLAAETWFLRDVETSKAVVLTQNLSKGTVINNENKTEYFEVVDIYSNYVTDDNFKSIDDIPDGVLTSNMNTFETLLKKDIDKKDDLLSYIPNDSAIIEMSVKVSDLGNAVGGLIRAGDLINISIVDSSSKISEPLYKNVYVEKSLDSSGNNIEKTADTAATIIVILVDEEMEQTINNGIANGTLKISRVK